MHIEHYGLSAPPFALTPDPRFWFESATHRKAMAYLGYGLAQGEGFIVITGEIGAGKTTLVGHLMETIDPSRVAALRIVSTQVADDDLVRLVAQAAGVPTEGFAKAQLLDRIERTLGDAARTGRKTLLIVDEAQGLSPSALEELRMLSNFQVAGRPLLQIVLLGQPEFRERLNGDDGLEQLRQRVIATHHLEAMTVDETLPYLEHRLGLSGWTGNPQFTAAAAAALHEAGRGLPRRINTLATRSLLMGALDDETVIDDELVRRVIADADAERPPARPVGASDDVEDRMTRLEAQIEEQEAALRRVLTLLIDWVEREEAGASQARWA